MDISTHICELLYNHDCVIIPGFGGFLCSYQPAAIHLEQNMIYPPCKAISFNRYLQNNDGLLVNHLAGKRGITFYEASEMVNAWANFSNAQLEKNEEIVLQHIGRFFNDAEGNLQFERDENVNYLKSSFGLRPLMATAILRAKETNGRKGRRLLPSTNRGMALRIAASVLILACMGLFTEMMWMNVNIKGLELNQASVASFVNRLFRTDEKKMEPIPIQAQQTSSAPVDSGLLSSISGPVTPQPEVKAIQPAQSPVAPAPEVHQELVPTARVITNSGGCSYYIIVGAFQDEQNAENMRKKLLLKFPADNILFEKHGSLTKVGYFAGNNLTIAKEQLTSAHAENTSYWMLKK